MPKPLHMENLASIARMGVSTLHHQFRALTAMSPLQYQKQLRLQMARQRMLMDGMDATSAAYEVGYESVSQFSREYSRFFGQPPDARYQSIARWQSRGDQRCLTLNRRCYPGRLVLRLFLSRYGQKGPCCFHWQRSRSLAPDRLFRGRTYDLPQRLLKSQRRSCRRFGKTLRRLTRS